MSKRHPKKKRRKNAIWALFIVPGILLILMIAVLSFKFARKLSYGQEEIDLSGEIDGEHVPLFLQGDKRWGDDFYGDDILSVNGCGPTCLAMVYCYYTEDGTMNPGKIAAWAEREGYYVDGVGTSWNLMDLGAEKLGLEPYTMELTAENIVNELSAGHVIICTVAPGDFTTEGHFIVLAGINENGTIRVNDPNSKKRSRKEWDVDRILPQIKQYWIY